MAPLPPLLPLYTPPYGLLIGAMMTFVKFFWGNFLDLKYRHPIFKKLFSRFFPIKKGDDPFLKKLFPENFA
jgi:hypothetical protein